jgi:hypothetical protein
VENNVISRRGREKYTHFEIGGHVEMAKSDPEAQKEVLVIKLHMVGKMSLDLLNLETLKFLMHFRELGSSLYFIFISYILIYFSFLIIFSYFISSSFFFVFAPLEL